MPYRNTEDKKAWARRDRVADPARYRRYRKGSEERARSRRSPCACGCGQTPRMAYASRYCVGHHPRTGMLGRVTSPSATVQPRLRDLAWAAGFLEGEGSFSKGSNRVSASQCQREPLDRLAEMFGGTVRERKDRTERPWHQQQIHQWDVSGSRARGVMMTIYLFMSPRRRSQIRASLGVQ